MMITFLLFFGLATLLVVGGVRGCLYLRTHRIATGLHLSGLRPAYAAPMHDTTGDETSRYYRKALITLILVMLSVMVIIIINTLNAAVIQ
jgi:hypothetical protein